MKSIPQMVARYFELNAIGDRTIDDDEAHAFYARCGRIEKQIAETHSTCDGDLADKIRSFRLDEEQFSNGWIGSDNLSLATSIIRDSEMLLGARGVA